MDLFSWKFAVHYFLHLIFPLVIAKIFFPKNWKNAYFIMLCTMFVDIDHLLSTPIFDPERGSIGNHVLHTYPMILIYFFGVLFLKGNYRIAAVGLLFHMFTDFQDFYFW
jgi:hypothetical protein